MDTYQCQQASPDPMRKGKLLKPCKFRMSCDCCSTAKVKCDQARPTCQRCLKLELTCHYSPSLRMGKRPVAQRRQFLSPGFERHYSTSRSVSRRPEYDLDSSSSQQDWSSDDTQTSCCSSMYEGTSSDPLLKTPFTFDQGCQPESLWSDMSTPWKLCSDTGIKSMSTTNTASTFGNTYAHYPVTLDVIHAPPSEYLSPTPNVGTSPGCGTTQTTNLDTTEYQDLSCAAIMQIAMHNLTLRSISSATLPICSSSSTTRTSDFTNALSIDRRLLTIRTTVELVTSVLKCSCICSGQLDLSIAAIVEKILSQYQDILNEILPRFEQDPRRPNSTSTSATAPIALGSYYVDENDQRRILIHIVSNDLRKAINLAEQFSSQNLLTTTRSSANSELVSAIAKFLRERVSESVNNVTKVLQTLVGFTGHVLVPETSNRGPQDNQPMGYAWA